MRLYLGIDGGQSSTTALIADENGRVIGEGKGGPCNHVGSAEGRAKFLSAVGDCLQQACAQAKLDAGSVRFASACLGFSGGSADKEAYTRELIRSERYKITHDAEIALIGATAGEPGIIVVAGTGSIAFGRNVLLKTARAGGWGYIFGDEGGGFDLVRQALRAALKHEEGWGPSTTLHQVLLEVSSATSADELMHRFYNQFDRTKIAGYAPLVTRAAENGDKVALEVLNRAADSLVQFVTGVYHQLFKAKEAVPVVPIGGAFESITLRETLREKVHAAIDCPTTEPRFNPAAGALLEALRLDGNQSPLSGLLPAGRSH